MIARAKQFACRYGWWIVWLAMSAWFARALWVPAILPLHDLPNHLARITALHYLDDPKWNLASYYQRSIGLVPYLGHFYPVHLLTYLVRDVTRANLVYLTLYLFGAPLGGYYFARTTGRSPWLALLLLPLAVCIFFQWGFISFCVGTMLILPAAAMLYRLLDAPTLGRGAMLGLLTIALYSCHILPWAAFGLYGCVLLLLELSQRRVRSTLFAAFAMLPSVAAFIAGLNHASSVGYISSERYTAESDTLFKLLDRSSKLLDLWRQQTVDERLQLALIVIVCLLIVSDAGYGEDEPMRVRLRVPLAALIFGALAMMTPFWIKSPFNWWMINVRFWMLVAAIGIFLPRGPIRGARGLILALGLACACVIPYYMTRNYRDFSRRVQPIVTLIKKTPLGSNTLYVHTSLGFGRTFEDPVLAPGMSLWREVYNYPIIYRGGYDPYLYDDGFPVKRIGSLPAPLVERAADWATEDQRRFDPQMMQGWDYFIVHDDYVDALPADGATPVQKLGGWTLYRNLLKNAH